MNNQNNFMIVQGENLDENQLLGKFVYYSLADVLVDKDDFTRICLSMNFPYAARRISVVDAFRNATGRVTRSITQNSHGSLLPRQYARWTDLFARTGARNRGFEHQSVRKTGKCVL